MREDSRGRVGGGTAGNGALEVLKAWCEVRTEKTPVPSDVAEERRRPCRARWGHEFSMGRALEKLGPQALMHPSAWKSHSPKFVVAISEPPRSRLTATLYAPNRLKE